MLNSTLHFKWSPTQVHLRVNLYLPLRISRIGARQEIWYKYSKSWTEILSAIQSVKFHVSHQIKCYSCYTCFSKFGELVLVRKIGPKYPTSWKMIHKKSFKVLNSTFHIRWSWRPSEGQVILVLVYLGNWGKSGELGPNKPSYGHQDIESHPKS